MWAFPLNLQGIAGKDLGFPEILCQIARDIFYFSSHETGAVVAPVLGLLIDNYGFYPTFTIASGATVAVTLICSVFL